MGSLSPLLLKQNERSGDIVQGTTQPFIITSPFKGSDIFAIKVTFWQPGNYGSVEQPLPIKKKKEHCVVLEDSYEFTVTLSPTETARFWTDRKAHMQAVITAKNGDIDANDTYDITVEPMFNGGNASTPGVGDIIILDGQNIK